MNNYGHLSESEKDEANRMGITQMEFIDILLKRINENNNEMIKKDNTRINLPVRKPYIVVGHGPDWIEQAKKLKNTDIPIISTDVCFKPLLEIGVIPRYVITYEEALKNVYEEMFDFEAIKEHKIKVIGSQITRQWLVDKLKEHGLGILLHTSPFSNVGAYGAYYAKTVLQSDRIILIGMNCYGPEKNYPFLDWFGEWKRLFASSNDKLFVNCTQGGLLYTKRVLNCDFNNLTVGYIS